MPDLQLQVWKQIETGCLVWNTLPMASGLGDEHRLGDEHTSCASTECGWKHVHVE